MFLASGSKKRTQIYFTFLSNVPANETSTGSQQGPYEERGPFTGHFAYISKTSSFGFPLKESSPKVPFMESLAERCPTTRTLLHSSIKVPGIRTPLPPPNHIPGSPQVETGPHGERCPYLETFLTIFQVPSDGTPPEGPLHGASSDRDASSTDPPSPISQFTR